MTKQKQGRLILVIVGVLLLSALWHTGRALADHSPVSLPVSLASDSETKTEAQNHVIITPQSGVKAEQATPSEDETFGERMVEFIRKLLGQTPKKIDINLVRDKI